MTKTRKIYTLSGYQPKSKNRDFVWKGEFRPPKKGEFFISGANPAVYEATADIPLPYHIARPAFTK